MFDGTYEGLFKAKLRDNSIEYSEDDYKKFCTQLDNSFPKGILDLSGQRIGINMLTKLTKVLRTAPHIRVFNLYGNLIRDHGIHSLLQLLLANRQVEVLDIGCNDLTNQSVNCLIDIIKQTRIRSFSIGTTGNAWHNNKFSLLSLINIINAIKDTERIECLNLSGLKMSYRDGGRRKHIAQEMSDFLANYNILKSLSLSGNSFFIKEESILTEGLTRNKSLVYLDFHDNILSDPVGIAFLTNLSNMKHLTYLDLRQCNLSGDSGVALAKTLSSPNIIAFLRLSGNNLGDAGVSELFKVMVTNQTLLEVDLSDNHFGEAVADILKQVIKSNQVLSNLDISKNSLCDATAFAIADSIVENTALIKLSVSSCKITDIGGIAIAKALVDNQTLQYFKMSDNFLSCESGYKILEHIKNNEKLFIFDVTSTQINHFIIKALNELSKRNRQIQKEVKLQPLKKQIVQLSIQRTKIPEAEIRFKKLEQQRIILEKEVSDTLNEIESTRVAADTNIRILKKTIEETNQMIEEEKKSKEKIAKNRERLVKEYEQKIKEDYEDIEKEKVLIDKYSKTAVEVENLIAQDNEDEKKKREEVQKLIDETLKVLNETIEATKDPEKARDFQPPEFPHDPNENDAFFLVDALAQLRAEEVEKIKKPRKPRRKVRRTSPNTARKNRRKKTKNQKDDDIPRFMTEVTSLTSRKPVSHVIESEEPSSSLTLSKIPTPTRTSTSSIKSNKSLRSNKSTGSTHSNIKIEDNMGQIIIKSNETPKIITPRRMSESK